MSKKSLVLALSCIFVCAPLVVTNAYAKEDTKVVKSVDTKSYLGTYQGVIPCADCGGKKTKLTLNEDTTYDLEVEYLDSKEEGYTENGTYTVKKGIVTTRQPSSNRLTNYKIVNGSLILVGSDLKLPNKELLEHYTLVKEDAVAKNYLATYEGVLPCADCEGIKTKLTFNEDTTYDLEVEYLGKKGMAYTENGTYTVDKDILTTQQPSTNKLTNYKILKDDIILVSDSKELPGKELFDHYILKRSK